MAKDRVGGKVVYMRKDGTQNGQKMPEVKAKAKAKPKVRRDDGDRAMKLQASPTFQGDGKPYSDNRRQVWQPISPDAIAAANAVDNKNFLMPGDTFDGLKPGSRIEYAPVVRVGTQPYAIRGTLEEVDGIRVGIHTANAKTTPYSTMGKYNVTDLYSGLAVGWGNTKAEAIQHFKDNVAKTGGVTAFKRTQVKVLENLQGRTMRWVDN